MYLVELYVLNNGYWQFDDSRVVSDYGKRKFIKKIKHLGFEFCPIRKCYVCETEKFQFKVKFHKSSI